MPPSAHVGRDMPRWARVGRDMSPWARVDRDMPPSARVLLVVSAAVLFGTVQAAAETGEPSPWSSSGRNGDFSATLDLLWTAVERAVRSSVEVSLAGLNTRLDSQHRELLSRLDGLQSELRGVETKLNTRISNIETRLQSRTTDSTRCSDSLSTHLAAQSTELISRMEVAQTQLESKLDGMTTELTTRSAELTQRLDGARSSVLTSLFPTHDCSDLPEGTASGVHTLQPGLNRSLQACCDMDTHGGGWTVLQRRVDIRPRQDFYLGWEEYAAGFGDLDGEFWWGLDNIWRTTSLKGREYELRVELEDFDNEKRYAVYQKFRVSSEGDGHRLTVTSYSGDAGDSLQYHSGMKFTTRDRDQDGYSGNCADGRLGAWWYGRCSTCNLNGQYLSGQTVNYGVSWRKWRGDHYSLKNVEMKIRPTGKYCN